MSSVPCIKGLRIPVATVVGMFTEGMREDEILQVLSPLVAQGLRQAGHDAVHVRDGSNASSLRHRGIRNSNTRSLIQ